MPSERKSSLEVAVAPYLRPGSRKAAPLPLLVAAAPSSSETLKWNLRRMRKVMRRVPAMSRTP
ncbi:hypothetical protein STANM309S_06376 [Streptomyces tanashiensis]